MLQALALPRHKKHPFHTREKISPENTSPGNSLTMAKLKVIVDCLKITEDKISNADLKSNARVAFQPTRMWCSSSNTTLALLLQTRTSRSCFSFKRKSGQLCVPTQPRACERRVQLNCEVLVMRETRVLL